MLINNFPNRSKRNLNFCQVCGSPAEYDSDKEMTCSCGVIMVTEISLMARLTYLLPGFLAPYFSCGTITFTQIQRKEEGYSMVWDYAIRVRPLWYLKIRTLPIVCKIFGESVECLEEEFDVKDSACE